MSYLIRSAALGAVLLLGSAGAASAVEAVASAGVNVRTGPGTGFSIVDQLAPGELVDVRECAPNHWCFVEHNGPDGWVSASYLTEVSDFEDEDWGAEDEDPDCSFGFGIGAGGPSLSVNCGDGPVPPLPAPPPPPPAPPPVVPITHSTGPIALQQTFTANLDNGAVGGGGVDIWYQAVNAAEKYVTTRNGARLALGDGSNRGFAGCSAAGFSSASIPLWEMPPGTYVCVRTSQGRISQFRVNSFSGTTMNIGYTTWAN